MKRYVRPDQTSLPKQEETAEAANEHRQEIDVLKLLEDCGTILQREIKNIMIEGMSKKLSPNTAKDLVSYVALLHKLKQEQEATLGAMTDEELAELKGKNDSAG